MGELKWKIETKNYEPSLAFSRLSMKTENKNLKENQRREKKTAEIHFTCYLL